MAKLTKQRATIDARIVGLESILKNASSESSGSRPQDPRARSKGKRRKRLNLGRNITALFEDGVTLRSRDVIERLRDAGMVVGGKVSLSALVHRELRRLAQRGRVRKRANGEYERIAGRVDARQVPQSDVQREALPT